MKFMCVDGEVELKQRDFERWSYVFSGIDLSATLKNISEQSYKRPWMKRKCWFFQLSGYLAKIEKDAD